MKTLVLVFLLSLSSYAENAKPVLNLATSHWPPYTIDSKEYKGTLYHLVKEAFETQGYKVNIRFFPWIRVLKVTKNKQFDLAFPAYYNETRKKDFTFSKSFFSSPLYLWKRKELKLNSTKIKDIKDFKIGIVRGYVNTPEIDNSKELKKEFVSTDKQNILKLLKKRIDLATMDLFTARYLIKKELSKEQQKELTYIRPSLNKHDLHLLLPKLDRSKKILEDFYKGLEELKRTKRYKEIIKTL